MRESDKAQLCGKERRAVAKTQWFAGVKKFGLLNDSESERFFLDRSAGGFRGFHGNQIQ